MLRDNSPPLNPLPEPGIDPEPLHSRLVGKLVETFYFGGATLGALFPPARPAFHGVERIEDIPYRRSGHPAHHLDIYRTDDCDGAPVVFYVHGGGFRFMSRKTHWLMGLGFARRGCVVVNIDYRLAPAAPYPAALVDTCHALQWTHQHIGDFGGDPNRIVVAGESAGANLALGATLASCLKLPQAWTRRVWELEAVPRAAVLACGIYEVSRPSRYRRMKNLPDWLYHRIQEVFRDYLGPSPYRTRRSARLADPLVILETLDTPDRPLPPVFAPVGTADPLLDDTRRLEAALKGLGTEVDVRYYPNEVHAFHALLWRHNARRCWGDVYSFLDRCL